jgi:hypothetical protein
MFKPFLIVTIKYNKIKSIKYDLMLCFYFKNSAQSDEVMTQQFNTYTFKYALSTILLREKFKVFCVGSLTFKLRIPINIFLTFTNIIVTK